MDIDEIWAQYGPRLRSFIASRVSTADVADELTQEWLIKVYKNWDSLSDKAALKPWLYRIARNVLNDYYRAHGRQSLIPLDEKLLVSEMDTATDRQGLDNCLHRLINALPENYRRTLTAVELNGVSQKVLAEQLGVSHATIKSQTQRGRAKLKKLFQQCCDVTLDIHGNIMDYEAKSRSCDCDSARF